MRYTLNIRYHVPFMQALVEALSGHARLSLEGDVSRCADDIERVPGVSHQETPCLRRNTLAPRHDFVILPIEPQTQEWIMRRILPRVGLHRHVWHVCIEKDGELQFAAYDNFESPCAGDAVPEEFLKDLVGQGVLKSYRRVDNDEVALSGG